MTTSSHSSGQPIEFFNRYTRRVETEQIYGEWWLRWGYETRLGRLAIWTFAQRAWFGKFYGWRMRRPVSRERIAPFIQHYGLEAAEFARAPESFASFDDFFSRTLRPGARPIEGDADTVVFGADGRHLGFQDASQAEGVFVKGQQWDIEALLDDAELARIYGHGTLVLSRLCPVDYHRFHFPCNGTPGPSRLINGTLASVNPIALRRRLERLWENKRVVTIVETAKFGKVLLLEIGATNVGSITQTFTPGKAVAKGDEKGFFSFGGSATMTIFEPGRVKLAEDLVEQTKAGRELYARMGSKLAGALVSSS